MERCNTPLNRNYMKKIIQTRPGNIAYGDDLLASPGLHKKMLGKRESQVFELNLQHLEICEESNHESQRKHLFDELEYKRSRFDSYSTTFGTPHYSLVKTDNAANTANVGKPNQRINPNGAGFNIFNN